jgi:hypothetical protein
MAVVAFRGCTNTRFVDAHHVEHWIDGRATKLENLVLLCRVHHRLVHEGGFRLLWSDLELQVVRPDGRRMSAVPVGPVVAGDAAAELARENAARGAAVGPRTGVPGWRGERADYDYMLAVLEQRDGRAPRALLKLVGEREGGAGSEDDWEPAAQVICE